MNATIIRFIEVFVAVFVATFGADAIFAGGTVDLSADGLQAIVTAAVAAALLAARRALATRQ